MPLFKSTLFIVARYSIINSYLHSILFLSLSLKVACLQTITKLWLRAGYLKVDRLGKWPGNLNEIRRRFSRGRDGYSRKLLYGKSLPRGPTYLPFTSVADLGKGPGGPGPLPPLIFRPNWGPKGRKIFFFRPDIPLISGWPPHVIWMSVSAMFIYHIWQKKNPLRIPSIDRWYSFHKPTYFRKKNSPSYLVSGTTFRNYLLPNLKEQFLCYINLVLDLLRWAGWDNSLNKAFQKIAPWLTSLELNFLFNCFECSVL